MDSPDLVECNRSDDGLTQSDIFDHYNKIADRYDEFYRPHYSSLADTTIRLLDLQTDDKLADVGGGTGGVADIIWKRAGLKYPPLVAEPNPHLLEKAKEKGLDTLLATADAFFSSPSAAQHNKFLFCHCLQHFPDWRMTFRKAFTAIPAGSVCLIILENYANPSVPLFSKALERQSLRLRGDNVSLGLSQIGFSTSQQEGKSLYSYTKKEWYEKIRGRYRSILELFTDEEIETGITELEQTTLKNTDVIQYENNYYYFIAVKER